MKYLIKIIFFFFIIIPLKVFSQEKNVYTILVGLKTIDDSAYAKIKKFYNKEATAGIDRDLFKMNRIAGLNNHSTTLLADKDATKAKIIDTIIGIGKKIKPGDTFVFYFSGHGDVIPDKNGDELSGFDQVLVAYDKYIIDDDLYLLFKKYFLKTENIMIIDACHSSTSWKLYNFFIDLKLNSLNSLKYMNEIETKSQDRLLDLCNLDSLKPINEPFNLIYFGATEDDNVAAGDINGGLLTYWLDRIVSNARNGNFWNQYSYRRLACELEKQVSSSGQNIQYHEIGKTVSNYSTKIPFKIY